MLPADLWDFIPDMTGSLQEEHGIHFRPVVDPLGREITALEAISDSPESAGEDEDKYIANLNAVRMALMKAAKPVRMA